MSKRTTRLYESYFNPDTFVLMGTAEKRVISDAYITQDAGYKDQEIEEIRALGVGQTWRSKEYGSDHTITRIQ